MAFGTVLNKELIREIKKVRKKLNRNINIARKQQWSWTHISLS